MPLEASTPCPRSASSAMDHFDANVCHCAQDLQNIQAQLVEAEQRVATLKAQYAVLQAAVNEAHDFIDSRFPLEIVSYIFELYVDSQRCWLSGDDFDSEYPEIPANIPLRLGAVCRSWRKIAWSLPRIWTSLRVNVRSAGCQHSAELARQWLERSNPYPLSIHVYQFLKHWRTEKVLDDSWKTDALSVVEVINLFASRWQVLTFDNIPFGVLLRINWETDKPSILRHLTLHTHDGQPQSSTAQPLLIKPSYNHHPTHITISHIDLKFLNVNWTNVTHFDGANMSLEDFFDMLKQTSSLMNCSFELEYFCYEDAILLQRVLPGSVVNTTLRKFTIQSRSSDVLAVSAMLNALKLPSLQALRYEGINPSDALFPFMNGFFCLQMLDLDIPLLSAGELIKIFQSVPLLKTLILEFGEEDGRLFELLSMTRPGSTEPLLLPKLESLQITTYETIRWETVANMYGNIQTDGSGTAQATLRYPFQRQSLKFDLVHQPGTLTPETYIDPASLLRFVHIIQGPGITIRSLTETGYHINFIEKSFKFHLSRGLGGPELASCYKMIEDHPSMTQEVD